MPALSSRRCLDLRGKKKKKKMAGGVTVIISFKLNLPPHAPRCEKKSLFAYRSMARTYEGY